MAYEFRLPDIGEGVVEGEIVRWHVHPGDTVARDQVLVEIMTDKATVEIPAPVAGKILECRGEEGDIVAVGSTLVVIDPVEGAQAPAQHAPAAQKTAEPQPARAQAAVDRSGRRADPSAVLATPAVRRLARSLGVDLTKVQGTGPGGRITEHDVEQAAQAVATPAPETTEEVPPAELRPGTSIPYRGVRRAIGRRLSLAQRNAVQFTYIDEVDVTALVELRQKWMATHPEVPLTYLPFILKAVVSGLQHFPALNAVLDEEREEIRLLAEYHIGIATATDRGLLVPVIRDVDKRNILELARILADSIEKARRGELKPDELKGSTFTVTSLGPLGGIAATPVINFPETAILGVHKIQARSVVREGEIVIRQMMNLSLTADHRVVDGLAVAQFIHHVIRLLETPTLLWLEEERRGPAG
ncbi:MAG: dihydrolipoamide acetyltransferase family protein [Acidobacteriota bacterium]